MTRTWLLTALALAGATPLSLAQQPPPPPRASTPRPNRAFAYSVSGNHGRIGVLVNTTADSTSDRYGARIEAVTPGGPADKAGLKAGDIITRFNGKSLTGAASEDMDNDESAPGHRLIELAHDLDPGDTVKIDYRRGSDTKSATIVADEGNNVFSFNGMGPMMRQMEMPRVFAFGDGGDMRMDMGMGSMCFGEAWCDLDLVTLNPDLGDYFGTKEGVLVVKAPADSGLPLKSGDVILSIGGRKPTSPSHAMRILRSYDPGETVPIDIMRHQKRSTLSWTVPEANEWPRARARQRGEQSMWIVPDQRQELRAMQDARQALESARHQEQRSLDQSRQQVEQLRRRFQDMVRRQRIATTLI